MSHLSILTKENLISILDKLKDKEYRQSWTKNKLIVCIENYDVNTYVNKMTGEQLKMVLEAAGVSTSGEISTLRKKFKQIINGETPTSDSDSSTPNNHSEEVQSNSVQGVTYTVSYRRGKFFCECKGYIYRQTCRHIKEVKERLENAGGMINTNLSNTNHFPGRTHCLLIGNANYASAPLPNSDNDAKQMNEVLKRLGHSTTLLIDANRNEMDDAIDDLESKISPDQGVLVYFSGHGCEIEGVSHMSPIENRRDRRSGSDAYGVNIDELIEKFSNAAFRIFIIDACRSDVAVALQGNKKSSVNTLQWYATSEATYAYAGNGSNSPFTSQVLQAITVKEHILDIAMNVQLRVLNNSGLLQIPEVTSTMTRKWFPNFT